MCLVLLRKFKMPTYGYKVFQVLDGALFNMYKGNMKKYKIGKIVNEKTYRGYVYKNRKTIVSDFSKVYPFGFHIFQTKKAAKEKCLNMGYSFKVYKVEIIEPVATGQEYSNFKLRNTIVSKKMRIIKEV